MPLCALCCVACGQCGAWLAQFWLEQLSYPQEFDPAPSLNKSWECQIGAVVAITDLHCSCKSTFSFSRISVSLSLQHWVAALSWHLSNSFYCSCYWWYLSELRSTDAESTTLEFFMCSCLNLFALSIIFTKRLCFILRYSYELRLHICTIAKFLNLFVAGRHNVKKMHCLQIGLSFL